MHHLEGKRALWLNGKEEAYIHTKILFKKWKSSSYNANGVETNLPLISYLPEWKQDKRKFEEQVAKDTKGNNKLFDVYQKYEVWRKVSVCTRP